ncbi:MAG TPA: hypothetical protein VMF65_22965, partial [Acidimicrobiales bacterium]|nr:hypothetical protein [Acidimicrobiales bacterium]
VVDRGGSKLVAPATADVQAPPPLGVCGAQSPSSWGVLGPDAQWEYDLGSPENVLGSNGQPPKTYTQALFLPGDDNYPPATDDYVDQLSIVAAGCWQPFGAPQPSNWPSQTPYPVYMVHFATTGPLTLNGVRLVPEGSGGELVVGTDGSIFATPNGVSFLSSGVPYPTGFYDIEVPATPTPNAPWVTIGRVDLFNHPLLLSGGQGFSFTASPQGPELAGKGITGGQVSIGAYSAEVSAYLPMSPEFTTGPGAGGTVTAPLAYSESGPSPQNPTGSATGSYGGGPCSTDCTPPKGNPKLQDRFRAAGSPAFSCPPNLSVNDLYLGGLQISGLTLSCNASSPYPFTGSGQLNFNELPLGNALPGLGISFTLAANGSFHSASVELDLTGTESMARYRLLASISRRR